MMFLDMTSIIDWKLLGNYASLTECSQRFEFFNNSCQFLVVLALDLAAPVPPPAPPAGALLVCFRWDASTKNIVVGSGLWNDPSGSLESVASPLHDSGKQSFHNCRKSFRPIAEEAVGAVAARQVSPTHCVHSVLSKLAPEVDGKKKS